MLQYTMRLRAQTWLRDRSIRHATAVAGSRPTGTGLRNMTRHPWGDSSGTEQGTRETGGAIRMGVIAAAIIFHQETKDVSSDLMVDGEDTRRYLRTCGFTEAESEEIIADARADQPSTSTTQDPVITLFRQHAFQDFLRKWPKQWARGRGDTAEEAARAGKTDAREASAGVVTPARTPARNDEGHVGTPSIPTPKALFTEHPRKLEEAHIMSIGEDPTHREVDALTPHSKPRARPGRWDKGPPMAATDAQGRSGDIRQPPAVGEGVVAVEASVVARPGREGHSPDARTPSAVSRGPGEDANPASTVGNLPRLRESLAQGDLRAPLLRHGSPRLGCRRAPGHGSALRRPGQDARLRLAEVQSDTLLLHGPKCARHPGRLRRPIHTHPRTTPPGGTHTLHNHTPHVRTCRMPGKR